MTLPAAIARQKMQALGHWVRDHFQRGRLHPVIDVLYFNPSDRFTRRKTARRTVRDSFEALVPQPTGQRAETRTLRKHLLVKQDSLAFSRDRWHNTSKDLVFEIECAVMKRVFQRRRQDPRRRFTVKKYDKALATLHDRNRFTLRWLTNRTKKDPLGEDRNFVADLRAVYASLNID